MKNNDHIQNLYADRASFYDRLFVDFLGWGKQVEAFFQKSAYLHPNFKILNAGCGTLIPSRAPLSTELAYSRFPRLLWQFAPVSLCLVLLQCGVPRYANYQ